LESLAQLDPLLQQTSSSIAASDLAKLATIPAALRQALQTLLMPQHQSNRHDDALDAQIGQVCRREAR
jgi:hypothetical protein